LISGCAFTPHVQSDEYKQVELIFEPFDWVAFLEDERTIPHVEKIDSWQYMIHHAKPLDPFILIHEGREVICYEVENHKEVLKQLYHGRLMANVALQMEKGWRAEREEKHHIIRMSQLNEVQVKSLLKLWTAAEDRNQKLERKIMIDGVLHKLTILGIIAGVIMFALVAL